MNSSTRFINKSANIFGPKNRRKQGTQKQAVIFLSLKESGMAAASAPEPPKTLRKEKNVIAKTAQIIIN